MQAIINASEDEAQIVEVAIHEVNEAGQNYYKLDVDVEMAHCDMIENSVSETAHKNWNASECLFIGTNFFHTKLKGFDFTSCELENIIISDTLEEIRGVKITAIQALEAARLLGMKVV